MLIICYLPWLSTGTVALPSIAVLDYNVTIRCGTSPYVVVRQCMTANLSREMACVKLEACVGS